MIPDEITRRRFPPAYGYKIPRFHFIDKYDPLLSSFNDITSETKDDIEVRAEPDSPEKVPTERVGFRMDENPAGKSEGHGLLPSNYSLRIASDQTTIATDIRKYLSSHHLNPIGSSNSIRYERSFRRLHF
jgi:hypothetical protein